MNKPRLWLSTLAFGLLAGGGADGAFSSGSGFAFAAGQSGNLSVNALVLQPDDKIRRVILCTGKVYYDLYEEREKRGLTDIYLLRVEQLYPFPHQELKRILAGYPNARQVCWVQEEPQNMGGWTFMEPRLERVRPDESALVYIGRDAAASPAMIAICAASLRPASIR